ncbi:MAG TPA: hypothetical protein PK335_00775 [Draconibacterium sp.]|nr:hypothetical protein [Draconibacterium sp.]
MKNIHFLLIFGFIILNGCHSVNQPLSAVFTKLESGTNASLWGLFVVNENVIWASGSAGTVLRSVDGEESWKTMQIPGAENNDFRSLHAWDENRAMVFGVAGPDFGYKTENGGETWEVVYQDTTTGLFFNSLKFADNLNGLAVSDPVDGKFFVIRTENGGQNWERVTNMPEVENGEANFAASNTCIEYLPSGKAWIATGGMTARVFYSEDFGKSWEVAKTPMIRGQASSGIFSIAFKNDREGIVVGGIYDQPEINTNVAAYTIDGGKNWISSTEMPSGYRSCVQFISDGNRDFTLAIGKAGCDYSLDGGISWNFLSNEGYYTFRAVPGKSIGFAAGSDGRIAKISFVYK